MEKEQTEKALVQISVPHKYLQEHKYLRYTPFDPNMSVQERTERAFITWVETVGIDQAIIEYMMHTNVENITRLHAVMKDELTKIGYAVDKLWS